MKASNIHYAINLRAGLYDELFYEGSDEDFCSYKDFGVKVTHDLAQLPTLKMSVDYEIWFEFGEGIRNRTMTKGEFKTESHNWRKFYRDLDANYESEYSII